MRADFQMIETYTYADEPPLDVPMLVLGGTEDAAVSAGQLMEWRRHTTQRLQCAAAAGQPLLSVRRRNARYRVPVRRAKSPRRRCELFSINWNSACPRNPGNAGG